MKIQMLLILVAFSVLGYALLVPHVQCSCQQMINENDCNNRPNCEWNPISATNGYCQPKPCSSQNQPTCQKSENCYYQPGQSGQQFCFEMNNCNDIQLSTGQTCQQANANCVQSNLTKSQCISAGFSCSTLSSEQCQSGQTLTLAEEGLCYWNGQSCQVVTSCGVLQSLAQCQMLNNACYWTGQACVVQQCSNYNSSNTCTYAYQNPKGGSAIQPCQWIPNNSTITNGTCTTATVDQLSISNCATNTNNVYRWSSNSTTPGLGQCAECNSKKQIYRNQCECKQLYQPQECISSPNCQWVPATATSAAYCQQNQCLNITSQQTCAQIQGCYWNTSANPNACTPYTSCNAIVGSTSFACFYQSNFCPGSNGKTCLNQQSLQTCSEIKEANICYNSIGSDGFCTYSTSSKACQALTSCTGLTPRSQCNQFINTCIWNTKSNTCQQRQCSDFQTKESCTFVQNNLSVNVINICTWNPDTKQCYAYDNSFDYDINTCFNSTGRTHHWSEPSTASKGLCLPCHYSSVLNVKSSCQCSDLINYTDCALSSPKCFWNSTATTKCQQQTCAQLTSQGSCVMSKYCYWSMTNNQASCQSISSASTTCATLKANTQQECLSQSILCGGINNGTCSSTPNSCSDFSTFYQCFGSVGTDGICQWNQNESTCTGISYCNMITTEAQCSLVLNTCFWQASNSSCTAYNCSSLYAQTNNCNYYLNTPNQNYEVKICQLEGTECNPASNLSSLTSSNCYASSGGTAFWNPEKDNGTCSYCYSQLIGILFIVFIYMF
ncbi:unnamed protein product [Paramecium sonneborni]|uniref:PSI domain-containing protein n=1 Tax=Paramecium sonneborni TaxID=65129 RepID=A0A8S1JXF9_9CILI|nr:unnamed protein product [Paramecium sonneborni]